MDYFERALDDLNRDMAKGLGSTTTPPLLHRFKFGGRLNPRTPVFYIFLFLVVLIILLLARPKIIKQEDKVSTTKVVVTCILITTPWIIWYYYSSRF